MPRLNKSYDYTEEVLALHELRNARDDADQRYRAAAEALMARMDDEGRKSVVVRNGDKTITAARMQVSRVVIDEPALKKRVGAKLWEKISVRVLDRKKLDAFIATGEVAPETVADVSTNAVNAPYIRLAVK